jgi:PhnB protein
MNTKVNFIPEGYHRVTPYILVHEAAKAIDFYKQVFGATEVMRLDSPNGKIVHAEFRVGDSTIMLADEFPEWNALSAKTVGGSPVILMVYVQDVDAVFARAVAAGAKADQPVGDKFYGDRSGSITDPFGHKWTISTHIEDVSVAEIKQRAAAMFGEK